MGCEVDDSRRPSSRFLRVKCQGLDRLFGRLASQEGLHITCRIKARNGFHLVARVGQALPVEDAPFDGRANLDVGERRCLALLQVLQVLGVAERSELQSIRV